MKLAMFAILMLLASCASTEPKNLPPAGSLLPSEAIGQRSSLNGHTVEIYGYLIAKFEDRGIWDNPSNYKKYESSSNCVSLLIPKSVLSKVEGNSGKMVVLRGKLVADLRARKTILLGICNFVGIEVDDVSTLGN
jgi:hypothetical protein